MNLVLLGGSSPTNKEWVEQIRSSVEPGFESTQTVEYEHWSTGATEMNIDLEARKLGQMAGEIDRLSIFAKSAGTWVVLKAVKDGLIKPEACLFVGTAVNFGRDSGVPIDEWLKDYSVPTLFVQKTNDPAIGFAELNSLLDELGINHPSMEELPGDDHKYTDMTLLHRFTVDYLAYGGSA